MELAPIFFYGYDFTEIAKTLDESKHVVFINAADKSEVELDLNKNEQLNLIVKFFEKIGNLDKYIIKTQCSERRNNKKKIFAKNTGEKDGSISYYWDGLVGVIQGDIVFKESDIREIPTSAENRLFEHRKVIIQIQSRFDKKNDNESGYPYFLSTMLFKCQKGFSSDSFVPSNNKEFFFDLLLLYIFKEKTKQCYLKGLYRTYRRFEKNDDKLKGSIDISRHIKLNMGLANGKIAYSYRENTIDNYLNHLILCAYDKLRKKYPNYINEIYNDVDNCDFRKFIDELSAQLGFSQIDGRTIISKNLQNISHPYYIEYEELRKISLKILRDEGLSIFDGDSEDVNGLLIYIPDLWELFLEKYLKDENYLLYTQGLNLDRTSSDGAIRIFNYGKKNSDKSYKQETYPDYVFATHENNYFMVLDAKFKPKWAETIINKKALGSGETGLLKDYDKCIRDMNSLNAHATGTIFPTNIAIDIAINEVIVHNISKYNNIDIFYTFPILVPLTDKDNYAEWYDAFEKNILPTIEKIKDVAKIEMELKKKYDFEIEKTIISTLRNN